MKSKDSIRSRKTWSKGRKVAAAVVGMTFAGGAAYAALTLVQTTADVDHNRVQADLEYVSAVSGATFTSDTGTDPTLSGDSGVDLASATASTPKNGSHGGGTGITVSIENSYEGYAPEITAEAFKSDDSTTALYPIGVELLDGSGEPFAAGSAPLTVELADGSCSTQIGFGTNPDLSGSPKDGTPITFRLVDTGDGVPQPVEVRLNYGPMDAGCIDGYSS